MARPDYNCGSLMTATVHISPRSEAIRHLYRGAILFHGSSSSTPFPRIYIYIHIACVVQFQRRRLASIQPTDFPPLLVRPIPPPLFSFFLHPLLPSIPFGCSVSQVQGRAHRTLCGEDKLEISCATKYRQRLDEYIFVCVCA